MPEIASGVLKLSSRGGGELRDPARSFRAGPEDARVPPKLIRKHGLPAGRRSPALFDEPDAFPSSAR